MKNFNIDLLKNEEVVYETGAHVFKFAILLVPIIGLAFYINTLISIKRLTPISGGMLKNYELLFLLYVLLLFLIYCIGTWIDWKKSYVLVTNQRILFRTGGFRQNVGEIFLVKLTGITLEQDTVGRLFNYGTIKINGDNATLQPLKQIANPEELKRQVLNQIHNEG